MFKSISKILLTGFITLLPVILTVYLLYWLAVSSENVMGTALRWVMPNATYFPGLGMIAGLVVVFIVGLLMKAILVRQLFSFGEKILYQLPLIKTVYRAMRDLFDFFTPKDQGLGEVVAVTYNGAEMIGFITQTDQKKLPESFREQDKVLVYLPMSYMIGGFTVFIPREHVRPIKMSMEEAMRFALTAGITGKNAD
ncbi:MAG: DUF502 domain-containing protein [Gammaproteobacteria bacterium]|nr:DUF502 domain-containing protein [Gammaproteobacteria bacterium]MBT8134606.1 DUF502 domain-containing protein [Gammaproteobacteria bacterium]NNJ49493.1 DUF502 domain-containing protein [Gammaproteobacteria bacterium]